ncbi:4-toluene sulfonate uptake permease [Chlorella sorokiniana]|uniref:4-toluene sulfonate uptake permease n=1 Tax=Chlorella sorokiniana TaxID=3076 RepID=A0A2P6TF41_CHLSO|nr:4-toluene sulfonate uptake permease [Chlorella sorokiniana]|eukprot:PRW32592.1 4-toluene sulfonate uptake permease [Chlorella sorokiniana]
MAGGRWSWVKPEVYPLIAVVAIASSVMPGKAYRQEGVPETEEARQRAKGYEEAIFRSLQTGRMKPGEERPNPLLSLPVGGMAGVVGSVAGSGGAAVIVPLVSKACPSIPQRILSGTSLVAVLTTACISTATFAANGCIDLPASLLIAPPAVLLAPLGARFTSRLNCNALKRLLGWFLVVAAPLVPLKAFMFASRAEQLAAAGTAGSDLGGRAGAAAVVAAAASSPAEAPSSSSSSSEGGSDSGGNQPGSWEAQLQRLRDGMPSPLRAAALVATGGLSGFISGLLGVGGGTTATPLVALIMPYTQATVLGTTLAAMVPTTAAAVAQHQRLGNLNWRLAAGLAVGSVLGGAAGSQAAVHAPPYSLEAVFMVTLLALARMTLKSLR